MSRDTKGDSRTLPAWYYRVRAIEFEENREVDGHDFDDDLSELEEDEEQDGGGAEQPGKAVRDDCECGGDDPECDCQFDSGTDEDEDESDRSYDGSDADYYYELKEEREERKQEKLQEREEKESQREFEKNKEDEVRTVYRSLDTAEKEGKTNPIGPLAGQSFKLFCSDHVDYFYSDLYKTKRVDFYHLGDMENHHPDEQEPSDEAGMMYGDVYLDANASCNFGPFRPPKLASRMVFKMKSSDDKYKLSFQFIGNGYLTLRVSREMVFMHPYRTSPRSLPPAAPEVFEFSGILWEERQEVIAKAQRPRSPRESWFETNHPMGSWYH
jgi:hypothetical protein